MTGSNDTLHRLGHGISYSETFVEEKWTEWSQYQSNLIPSNISGVPTSLVSDNIDWKNKSREVAMKPITQIVYLYSIKKINS